MTGPVQEPVHGVRSGSYGRPMLILDPFDAQRSRPAGPSVPADPATAPDDGQLAAGFVAAVESLGVLDERRLAALAAAIGAHP